MTLSKIIMNMRESSPSDFPKWGSVAYDAAERHVKGICLSCSELRVSTIFIIKQHFKSHHKTLLKKTMTKIKQYFAVDYNILRFSVTVFGWQVYARILLRVRITVIRTNSKRGLGKC